jgi:hypothetical protein
MICSILNISELRQRINQKSKADVTKTAFRKSGGDDKL